MLRSSITVLLLLGACGGSAAPQPPSTPEAPASSASAATGTSTPTDDPPTAAEAGLPSKCADASSAVCTPSSDFVDRLCNKPHQDIALWLFGKDTPFTRLYLRGKMDELAFDEEVLALRYRATPKGGIQVGNSTGSYDVLRWDGSCALAVDAEMITKSRPPKPRNARVQWHRIAGSTQDALIAASDAVKRARAKRGKECQGAMSGDVSAACEKADASLVSAVVDYVRGGGSIPTPDAP
ncbi:MAG TPA: hypothetical protein VMI75_31450 [Polyangiaceae bacterium]|nr:hypothetical protein [Polyangiaceae bacterium]